MFATIVGGALALVFIGLPLAIIGLFIQSILERRNARPAGGYQESKPVGSEHLSDRARTESDAAPSHRRPAAAHRHGLAAPIGRHHDARTSVSPKDYGRGERRELGSDRHSMVSAPSSALDHSAQARMRDRRA